MADGQNYQAALAVLKLTVPFTESDLKRAYKAAIQVAHPDLQGGSTIAAQRINAARDLILSGDAVFVFSEEIWSCPYDPDGKMVGREEDVSISEYLRRFKLQWKLTYLSELDMWEQSLASVRGGATYMSEGQCMKLIGNVKEALEYLKRGMCRCYHDENGKEIDPPEWVECLEYLRRSRLDP